ncbi:MAG: MATE family efflux transporter [Flavobacteriaceae bacterium]|nr:polysaccharide biosynthesis C-terminal domain-containing protein [Flavobacteriaceae bacterium]
MSIKDLTQKSFSVLIIRSFGVLLLFGFTLFITNFYSAENVGRYDFVRSTLMVLGGISLMGTNQSIIYYSGLLNARKSIESIRSIYSEMLKIIFTLSLIILGFFMIFFNESIINDIFKNRESYSLILKTILTLVFFAVTMLNIDTIRALKKTILSEMYRSIFRYLPVFIFAIILLKTNNEELLVEVYLLGFLLLSLFSSIRVYMLFKKIDKPNDKSESFTITEIFKTSSPMALSAIAYFIMQSIDIIILSIYEGFDQIAYYSVSVKLAMLTTLALMSVNIVIAPRIAEIYENQKMQKLQMLIKHSTRIIFLISICVLSVLFFFSEEILGLFGQGYVIANNALLFLLAAQFFNAVSGPGAIYLNMTGRQKTLNKILVSALIINISLNFYLIPTLGINGAAIATLVSLIIWNTITTVLIYSRDKIKIFLN